MSFLKHFRKALAEENTLRKAEDPEGYKKLASTGFILAHPVKIKGQDKRADNGISYHSTVKFFDKENDDEHEAHKTASNLDLTPPNPKETHIKTDVLKDRNGNDVYAVKLHGKHADKLKENHKKFSHLGHPENYDWNAHISVPKAVHDEIKAKGHKTAHDAGIEFGPAQLKRGPKVIHTYGPKEEMKKSEGQPSHREGLSKPHFLLSAENPLHPHKNELGMSHEQVLGHLKQHGYDAHEVMGHYGAPEKSILIHNVNPQQSEQLHGLASKLGQDSSIYSTGKKHEMRFHHGEKAGQSHYGEGTQFHAQKPEDFFTTLPSGEHFTHGFDFSQTKPSGQLGKAEGEDIHLVHYSPQAGLKYVDPKFSGSGVDSRTKGRETEHPHSFYYRHGTEPEEVVTSRAPNKYHVKIGADKPIYDIGQDPKGLVRQAIEENQGIANMDMVHSKLKEHGFHGFHNSNHPSLSHVVAMYHPQPVHAEGELKESEETEAPPLTKPYSSDAQRRWAHTEAGKKALGGEAGVHEWDEATKGKKLPEHVKKSEELEKGALKNLLTAGAMGAALASAVPSEAKAPTLGSLAPQATQSHEGYNRDKILNAISQVESSGGKNVTHKPTERGTAFGRFAIMPDVIHDTIRLNPDLKRQHQKALNLQGDDLHHYMQDNPKLEEQIANKHLQRLEHHFGHNPEAISFAWNQGILGANRALKAKHNISEHPYVQKFKHAYEGKE